MPATYISESTVLVEPPKVPSNLVEPNVQVDLADRVQSMSTQVESRTRLLNLIQRFNLYPGYVSSPDDQVVKMRDDIKMELVKSESATPPAKRKSWRSRFPSRRPRPISPRR